MTVMHDNMNDKNEGEDEDEKSSELKK